MQKYIMAEAIAKIILIGEHSVVYGKPAIAIPFNDAKIQSTMVETYGGITIKSDFYSGKLDEVPEIISPIRELIYDILEEFGEKPEGFHVVVRGNIPYQRGMGSSASLSICVVRSLYKYYGRELDCDTLIKWANVSEGMIHGNASGIDVYVVAKEKPVYYIKGKPFEELELNLDAYLLIADTGKKGMTKEAVSYVRKLVDSEDKYKRYIEELGKLTDEAKVYIESNQVENLGNVMTKAQRYLEKLSISDETLDSLIEVAMNNGAYGAKLTGGGRGGCMISLFPTREMAQEASVHLKNNGAKNTWIAYLGGECEKR